MGCCFPGGFRLSCDGRRGRGMAERTIWKDRENIPYMAGSQKLHDVPDNSTSRTDR